MAFGGDLGSWGRDLLAAAIAALVVTPASAGLIPGGGSVRSDCYVEFDVQGAGGPNTVTCTDGQPGCDNDGLCDGTCTFRVALCPNQKDPTLGKCSPSSLTGQPTVKGASLAPVPTLSGSSCGAAVDVPVQTRKGGAKKGKLKIRVKATAVGSSRVDLQACKLEYSIVSPK